MYQYQEDDKDKIICKCMQVKKSTIMEAIVNQNLTSVAQVGEVTKAGTKCTHCADPKNGGRPRDEYIVDLIPEGQKIRKSLGL